MVHVYESTNCVTQVGTFINRGVGSEKEILWSFRIYMEAEKSIKKRKFSVK